jgi:thiamine biosynthesis lipoprotein
LEILGSLQAKDEDHHRDAEPGKILGTDAQIAPSPQGPEPRAIGQALALVDWQGVDVTCRRIAMAQPGMGLTLNGIAQGYLTDRIVDILRANG